MSRSMIAVRRLAGNDGRDKKHYLTVLSPENPYAFLHLDLPIPFDMDNPRIEGCTCRGLSCFYDILGNSVICNLATRSFKLLPPPNLEPPPNLAIFKAYGFGYAAKSDEFKVLRTFVQYYSSPTPDAAGVHTYLGCKVYSQLYTHRSNAWKDIALPDSFFEGAGVYIEETGCCYFQSYARNMVVYFNFDDETLDHFPLPPRTTSDLCYRLVECGGLLGAITFHRPHDHMSYPKPRGSKSHIPTFEIFVRRGASWDKLYKVSHRHVERPLGIRDGRFLYMEAKRNWKRSQLLVFDLSTKDWKKFNIYDRRGELNVFFYDESSQRLPGSEPMRESMWTEAGTSKDEENDTEH